MATLPPPLPLTPLKDALVRVAFPAALDGDVNAFLARPVPADAAAHRAHCEAGVVVADRCVEHLEAEIARLTEQRFQMGDASTLKQKMLADPRRQADNAVSALKNKAANEKGEWSRRASKQATDVLDSVEKELRDLKLMHVPGSGGHETTIDDAWAKTFFSWLDDSLATWSRHAEQMLPQRMTASIEVELRALNGHLMEPLSWAPAPASSLQTQPSRLELPALREASEVPSIFEAFFELFKGGLNTAAMLAGLVIVPVVGSLSHEQPVALRAMVMTGFIVPILGFAIVQTRKQRRRLADKGTERAQQKIKKDLEVFCKTKVDRFKAEVERWAHGYVASSTSDLTAAAEQAVQRTFAKKEEGLAGEMAKAQLTVDKLAEQINAYKQVRQAIAGTFLVEAKRRLRELEAA